MAELIFNTALAGFLLIMLFYSKTFRTDTVDGDLLKSGGFPALLIIIGICILAVIIIRQIKDRSGNNNKIIDISTRSGKAVLINILILTAYISVLNTAGYAVSTLLFTFFAASAMGYKKYRLLIVYAAAVTVIFIIVFGRIFYVPLPRGTGFLRELSYYIY